MVAVAFLAVGCKNKKAAKTLEGTWNEVNIDGTDIPPSSQDQITFGKCSGGSKADCDLTVTDCCGGGSYNYNYSVDEGGTNLIIRQYAGLGYVDSNHEIAELTDNSLTIKWKWGSGSSYTGKYTKN